MSSSACPSLAAQTKPENVEWLSFVTLSESGISVETKVEVFQCAEHIWL